MGFNGDSWCFFLGSNGIYPLVTFHITMENKTPFLMGKFTISTGSFSIARLNYRRV